MKISSISCYSRSFPKVNKNNKTAGKPEIKTNTAKNNNVSFKSIYLQDSCELGKRSDQKAIAKFKKKDALLLNEIANRYPYQDCFISAGNCFYPELKYREKPVDVQIFSRNIADEYVVHMDPDDEDNPAVPLILVKKEPLAYILGVPTGNSLNPSIAFTVQAGYELHKKMLEKKYEILDSAGQNDDIDFGDKTVTELAHEAIAETESAVKRYLMESAYAAMSDRASAKQLYASNLLKVQTRLQDKRRMDLTTSYAKQDEIRRKAPEEMSETDPEQGIDICEMALRRYPDIQENTIRIKELMKRITSENLGLL